ncbi:probable prolyl 4-hydroxylase 12 isoform X2 [Cornus florida]|uniref:probable prolyl 4-hydroxylase 12 isoform X2 n=1 Tax=Cornus florida TaxID=4283 RepID=UPI0028A1C67A|nr:probable prolyl 4-hydroxylase 12 isoform X2 [Cornus florida]
MQPFHCISRKELRTKEVDQEDIIQLSHPVQSNRIDPSRVIQLSWRPRVFLYKGFLSDEECDSLISQAQDKKGSSSDPTKVGTNKDDIIARIEERISAWTFLPKGNSKTLQVLHFGAEVGKQKYDYFGDSSTLVRGEPLMATVILYLSNVSQGGRILFPKSENKIWSDCVKSSNILNPSKGNAILFFNLRPNASPDMTSSHARCPVLEGEMWFATKFFHVRAIPGEEVLLKSDNSECTDEDERCPQWASLGECQRNPVFMIGSPDYYGTCKKSCNAC